jgi:hypothetical protein
MHFAVGAHFLLLRLLVCSLGVTVSILAMRVSRAGVYFRLFVLALIVVMGRFPVVMCGSLVF